MSDDPTDAMQLVIRCPECGLTAHAPAKDAVLPENGPVCAMGHPEVRMEVTEVQVARG